MSDEISRRPQAKHESQESRYQSKRRAPFLVRFVAQICILLIFLAAGYYGSDLFFKFLDSKNIVKQEGVVSNSEELQQLLASDNKSNRAVVPSKELTVYSLGRSGMVKLAVRVMADIMEDEVMEALKAVFTESSEAWANVVTPKHVYRDGSVFYVDMSRGFAEGIGRMTNERALLMLTSIVRTVDENFLPGMSKQIFFLQEGKWIPDVGEIKLSEAWGI